MPPRSGARLSLLDVLRLLRAVWPMLRRALLSGQILRPQCVWTDHPDHLDDALTPAVASSDLVIPLPDGTLLTATCYRSAALLSPPPTDLGGSESDSDTPSADDDHLTTANPIAAANPNANRTAQPVIMCAHPYDARITAERGRTPFGGPPFQYRIIPQPTPPRFSRSTSWEAPDPAFWTAHGYTVVNLNMPGFASSGGAPSLLSAHQARDFFDAIEWVVDQPWCTGRVGLSGVSYLAMSQYQVAACRAYNLRAPRGLCAIAPWEGLTDLYRDLACVGGVADTRFFNFWWHAEVRQTLRDGPNALLKEEGALPGQFIKKHPWRNAFWTDKNPALRHIHVPTLQCASFSDHELHSTGSFRAFDHIATDRKWLYTHRDGKWSSYYDPQVQALALEFMNCFLKGQSNRFSGPSSVRVETRASRNVVHAVRWETAWPIPRTKYVALRLTAGGALSPQPAAMAGRVSYRVGGNTTFDYTFREQTELSGFMSVRLWLSLKGARDAVLCCYVEKLDADGREVRFNGSIGTTDDVVTRGYIRASRRQLDEAASTEWHPVQDGVSSHLLDDDEHATPVQLDVALCASSTVFDVGESVRLVVSSVDTVHAPVFGKCTAVNRGSHVLHFGGAYEARLLIPVVPPH